LLEVDTCEIGEVRHEESEVVQGTFSPSLETVLYISQLIPRIQVKIVEVDGVQD
jgi:hypothetical protein